MEQAAHDPDVGGVYYGHPNFHGQHYGGPPGLIGPRAPLPSEVACVPYFAGDSSDDSHDRCSPMVRHVGRVCIDVELE